MKLKYALLLLPVLAGTAHAGYVDYRHEYYDDGRNYDRVYMSQRFASGFGVALEGISRSDDADAKKPLNNMETNGIEYTANYQFTWSNLVWLPGIAIETDENQTIYKPFVRVQYNINDNWWTAFRYRFEYTRRNAEGRDDRRVNRPDKFAEAENLYNNTKRDYEYNGRIAYKFGSWVPFVEVGNVSSGYKTATTDDRQTRYRVGIGYNF